MRYVHTLHHPIETICFWCTDQIWPVTVNGDRYRAMLNEFLFTKIEEKNIGNIWCQQDGTMCHTAEATLDVFLKIALSATSELRFETIGLLFVGCRRR